MKRRGLFLLFLFVVPASTTYQLSQFGFGGGGVATSTSSHYAVEGVAGEVSSASISGATYNLNPGLIFTQQAAIPAAPSVSNPASYYNKLKVVLNVGSNASDTTYAIASSTDGFASSQYVQGDGTLSSTPVYQTYSAWGGSGGVLVVGLNASTTYYFRASAMQGGSTESGFSSSGSSATVSSSLSFDIDVSATDQSTSPPYLLTMGNLTPGSVNTATQKIWISLDTNGEGGGSVYVFDSFSGLKSTASNHTITSATGDLSTMSEGYGLQSASLTQTSGGPLIAVSPFDGASQNVGGINTTSQVILTSSSLPVSAGRASINIKAKPSVSTPAASDYADTLTMVASAAF